MSVKLRETICDTVKDFCSAADHLGEGFLRDDANEVVIDMWNTNWGSIGDPAEAADRLITVFKNAGLFVEVQDQPSGPARESKSGCRLAWDNFPLITVAIPASISDETIGEIKGIAKMVRSNPKIAGTYVSRPGESR